MTDRQQLAFSKPIANPAELTAEEFTTYRRLAAGVLVTILTVNR